MKIKRFVFDEPTYCELVAAVEKLVGLLTPHGEEGEDRANEHFFIEAYRNETLLEMAENVKGIVDYGYDLPYEVEVEDE